MPIPTTPADSIRRETDAEASQPHTEPGPSTEELWKNLRAIAAYLGIYLETYLDRGKLTLKNLVLGIVLTLFILLIVSGAVVVGAAFLFYGLALGLSELCGGRAWVGFGGIGALLLLTAYLGVRSSLSRLKSSSFHRRMEAYTSRAETQQAP